MLCPRCEEAQFAVVAIVCEPHLGSDKEDLPVENDDPAIVDDILVIDGHPDVAYYAIRLWICQDLCEYFP